MSATANRLLVIALCAASTVVLHLAPFSYGAPSSPQTQQAAGTAVRRIGAVKAINGTAITLTPDSSADVSVSVQPTTRIVRIAPGEKDLKNATPIQLQDLQVGDRILVGGKLSDDNLSLVATSVVVMKRSDLDARHEQDLQDWQKRGVDGLASAVDAAAGTVTITTRGKKMIVHASNKTVIRRYAPDSVKFDDARPSTLQEVRPGDQMRARGERTSDGTELAAEEIVSGTFRNIAGTVNAVNETSSTLSVHDLVSNKTLSLKITPDSQLRHLSPELAQRVATRLKGTAPGVASNSGPATSGQESHPENRPGGMSAGGNAAGGRPGGAPDIQQMLSRIPAASLADLHKGDAVLILSTEGIAGLGTVITLVSGVEPVLQAAPGASSASILTPWSLSAPSGDSGGP